MPEVLDAMRCAGQPGVLTDRATLKEALRAALVKDRRDLPAFDEVFDAFFALVRIGPAETGHGHGHAHDDLSDSGTLETFTLSEEPGGSPQQGHEHGAPADIRDYFDPRDLAQSYNLHQEANKIDLAALTDEIVLSQDADVPSTAGGHRIRLDTERLRGAGPPGRLSTGSGTRLDAELTVTNQDSPLHLHGDGTEQSGEEGEHEETGDHEDDEAALRRRLAGVLAELPESLKRHLEALLDLEIRAVEHPEAGVTALEVIPEQERAELEESLRRLARSLHGALTHRRRIAGTGRIDAGRTVRRNLRFDGIPFSPVTVRRAEDRPRLVVLADVSLSVRRAARFTLHLVHGLQSLFTQVRSFAFVAEPAEITELFADHPAEHALGLVFGGDVVDVDADSDYGAVFGRFLAEHSGAVTRRTTLVVLGDGRSNGRDPNLPAFAELTRRARQTIWLTPEPRYSWGLGGCDLPAYSQYCDRVRVVSDLSGLARVALDAAAETAGR